MLEARLTRRARAGRIDPYRRRQRAARGPRRRGCRRPFHVSRSWPPHSPASPAWRGIAWCMMRWPRRCSAAFTPSRSGLTRPKNSQNNSNDLPRGIRSAFPTAFAFHLSFNSPRKAFVASLGTSDDFEKNPSLGIAGCVRGRARIRAEHRRRERHADSESARRRAGRPARSAGPAKHAATAGGGARRTHQPRNPDAGSRCAAACRRVRTSRRKSPSRSRPSCCAR